jgi:phosphonoacetaldehyde hydrolase
MLDNRCIPPHTVAAQKLRALIFDWAGTTVDFGSLAPVRAIQKAFQEFGVPVDESTVRRDMGLPKRNHIAQIFSTEKVQAAWKNSQGALPPRSGHRTRLQAIHTIADGRSRRTLVCYRRSSRSS